MSAIEKPIDALCDDVICTCGFDLVGRYMLTLHGRRLASEGQLLSEKSISSILEQMLSSREMKSTECNIPGCDVNFARRTKDLRKILRNASKRISSI